MHVFWGMKFFCDISVVVFCFVFCLFVFCVFFWEEGLGG